MSMIALLVMIVSVSFVLTILTSAHEPIEVTATHHVCNVVAQNQGALNKTPHGEMCD